MPSGYEKINIDDLEDQASGFGVESLEARFARQELGAEALGLSHYRVKPGEKLEFGHRHKSMEEMYVVLAGSGSFRVGDETLDIAPRDVVYVEPQSWRGWAAGPDGLELLAFGSHVEGDDESEMKMGWWS